jgi:hypothetical protein
LYHSSGAFWHQLHLQRCSKAAAVFGARLPVGRDDACLRAMTRDKIAVLGLVWTTACFKDGLSSRHTRTKMAIELVQVPWLACAIFFFTAQLYHSTRKSERVEQLKKKMT